MKFCKRLTSLCLVLAMLFTLLPASVRAAGTVASGTCGDNLTWTLDDAGTLTVSGSGDIHDYSYHTPVPWSSKQSNIRNVVLEDGVTSVGSYAFYGSSNLTGITIPSSVVSIGSYAFSGCASLTDITIPDSVTHIGSSAFNRCSSLTGIHVAADNPNYASIDGILFDKSLSILEQCPGGKTGQVTVSDNVSYILSGAFRDCIHLTDIIVDPENRNYCSIDGILYKKNATEIEQCPAGKTGHVNIPDSVTTIGFSAFDRCTGLTGITIPDSVTSIEEYAFASCSGLTHITIPDSVTGIEDGTFSKCTGLVSISIPNSVTRIGNNAFWGCTNLTDISIPNLVTSIGSWAFYNCASLTYITIPKGITCIDDSTFSSCEGLSEIIIPTGVTSIGDRAFDSCANLTSIILPDTVTDIGKTAFWFCNSLTDITIPGSVTSIGSSAFAYCDNLASITFAGDAPTPGGTVFSGVTATAYYPGYSASWNEEVQKSYGGNITWIPIGTVQEFAELKVYSSFPNGTLGVDQTAELLVTLMVNGQEVPFVNGTLTTGNEDVLDVSDYHGENGALSVTLRTLSEGTSDITITESSTGASVTLTLRVEDNYMYYRCTNLPVPDTYLYPLYITDYQCTENSDGTHDVSFNAYNISHVYGTAIVYDQDGNFVECEPLNPIYEGTGMEWVANNFWYVWDSAKGWFDDREHYEIAGNAVRTPVKFQNLPAGSKILITADPMESPFPSLYTGMDVFLKGLFAGSGIDMSENLVHTTVKEFVKEILSAIPKGIVQNTVQSLASDLSLSLLNGVNAESAETIYNVITSAYENAEIDLDQVLNNILKSAGWSVADSIAFSALPVLTYVDAMTKVLSIGWIFADFRFSLDRGITEIHMVPHGPVNQLISSAVVVVQAENFAQNVILDTYLVTDESEIPTNASWKNQLQNYSVFNITLRENGEEIQPENELTVYIPIPAGANTSECVLYRVEETGELTELPTEISGNYLMFKTPHLSYYIIGERKTHTPGDINGDREVNNKDLTRLFQYLSGYDVEVIEEALDINGDGSVNNKDLTRLFQYLSGYDVEIH